MYLNVNIYSYTCSDTYIFVYICRFPYICIFSQICIHIEMIIIWHIQKYASTRILRLVKTHLCVYIYVYLCNHIHKRMYEYMCINFLVCILIYTYFLNQYSPALSLSQTPFLAHALTSTLHLSSHLFLCLSDISSHHSPYLSLPSNHPTLSTGLQPFLSFHCIENDCAMFHNSTFWREFKNLPILKRF